MINNWQAVLSSVLLLAFGTASFGALVTTHTDNGLDGATVDGVISANEYGPGNSYSYTGAGGGFGGTVGSGTLYMESDLNNLYLAFQPGNSLNDNVVIHFDTRPGGFLDSQMSDTQDPGRNLISNLTRDVDDVFPAGFLPDFGATIWTNGFVLFELNAGNTPGHLEFKQFDGNSVEPREVAISLANLEVSPGAAIKFFVSYGSDTNFMSNESMPAEPFNAGGNPGFDNSANGGGPVVRENWHQFVVVPEPSSFMLLGLGSLLTVLRRRRS